MTRDELLPFAVSLVCLVVSLSLHVDWHAWRRRLWALVAFRLGLYSWARTTGRCASCGVKLAPAEREHYGYSCSACEAHDAAHWRDV